MKMAGLLDFFVTKPEHLHTSFQYHSKRRVRASPLANLTSTGALVWPQESIKKPRPFLGSKTLLDAKVQLALLNFRTKKVDFTNYCSLDFVGFYTLEQK